MPAPAAAAIVPAIGTAVSKGLAAARTVDIEAAVGDMAHLASALTVAPVAAVPAAAARPRREERLDHTPSFPAPRL